MHVKLGTYNFNKTLKTHLQASENKCIRFCQKLGVRTIIKINVFEKINCLSTHANQCTLSSIYKFHDNNAPGYMNEIFSHAQCYGIPTRCFYQKVELLHHKTTQGLRALLYIGPSLWNNLDKSLETSVLLNVFKHNLNNYYFRQGIKMIGIKNP